MERTGDNCDRPSKTWSFYEATRKHGASGRTMHDAVSQSKRRPSRARFKCLMRSSSQMVPMSSTRQCRANAPLYAVCRRCSALSSTPGRVRGDAEPVIGHDDAMSPPRLEANGLRWESTTLAHQKWARNCEKYFSWSVPTGHGEPRNCGGSPRTHSRLRELWPNWRARQDLNLRPSA
jgi:hypothetical protein